jgi:hypothetical protein
MKQKLFLEHYNSHDHLMEQNNESMLVRILQQMDEHSIYSSTKINTIVITNAMVCIGHIPE